MTKKISPLKISKIISLHKEGYTQTEISDKLKVDQSTAGKYIAKYDNMVKEKGFATADAAFEVYGEVEDPQTVVQEFHESGLTMSDVHVALQIKGLFDGCGINPGNYLDFIKTIKKTKAAGYVEAAMHLNKLEKDTGMNYGNIVATADQKSSQLHQAEMELNNTKHKIASLNAQLKEAENTTAQTIISLKQQVAEAEKTTAQKIANLKLHMQNMGVEEDRLKKVEALALAIKSAGISDNLILGYISRQQSINKAGVSIDLVDDILSKVKVATKVDGGKHLLGMLEKFGGLASAISNQQAQIEDLLKETSDLEAKAKLKAQLEEENGLLKGEKAILEPRVAQLKEDNVKYMMALDGLHAEWNSRTAAIEKFGSTIAELQAEKSKLEDIIATRKNEVSDLDQIKADRDKAHAELSELREQNDKEGRSFKEQTDKEGRRWQVYLGFLGLVQSTTRQELVETINRLPVLLEISDQDEYPVDFLRNKILKDMGVVLQWAKCSCGVTFFVDKPTLWGPYKCPVASGGQIHTVAVVKQTDAVLGEALVGPKTGGVVAVGLASGPKSQ